MRYLLIFLLSIPLLANAQQPAQETQAITIIAKKPPVAVAAYKTDNIWLNSNGSRVRIPTDVILSYKWSKYSGGACTILNPNKSTTQVTNMKPGAYFFQLLIISKLGRDSVLIPVRIL